MKLIKVVKKETYEKSKNRINYFALQLDNGAIIPIKPIFATGYNALNVVKDKVIFEKED